MTDLVDALRAKYRTPGEALRALGLDEGLIKGGGKKPRMSAVATAIKTAIKTRTGIAEDAGLADLLDLLDALKQSEEGHVSEIDKAEAAAKEAFGLAGGGEEEGEAPGAKQERTDEFEPDPKPAPKPEAKPEPKLEAKPELKPEPKKESKMAGLEPNAGIPALAEKEEEKAKDEGLEEGVVSDDPATKLHAILRDKLSPEELKSVGEILLELAGGEEVEEAEGEPGLDKARGAKDETEEEAEDESEEEKKEEAKDEEPASKEPEKKEGAMDAATVKSLIKQAVLANDARHLGIRKAIAHVKRSPVGELAMDENWKSSDDVYRSALKAAEVPNVDAIHPSAFPSILDLLPRAGAPAPRSEARLAQDAAAVKVTLARFPDANRLKRA